MSIHYDNRKGLALVLSSPSGAGKTTLARQLLEQDKDVRLSVSATTRPPRPGEVHETDYYFVDKPEFESLVHQGGMLEHAQVFDNYYGSPKGPVDAWLDSGQDVLFDIDWQGARQLRASMSDDVVSIFILPPSAQALRDRLQGRADQEQKKNQSGVVTPVQKRMDKAKAEIQHWHEYDYILVNDNLHETLRAMQTILSVERQKRQRVSQDLNNLVNQINEDITCLSIH